MALGACSVGPVLGDYDLPESPEAAAAPWPKLVDAPEPVASGVYTAATPNPINGLVAREELATAAAEQAETAAALADPVIAPAAARRLQTAAR